MVGITELKAFHQFNQKALEIHWRWDDLDAPELLPLAASLKESAQTLSDLGGEEWHRKKDMSRHLTCLVNYLKDDEKDKCWSDIKDLIYADLPALGYRLLTLADSRL
ncbi:hypothetical protein Q7L38_25305 [Pseudomonas protegens]|uniref:hypothetical protein n=1 Tax=Pseudomonas protegens TaxID=380021 RepID=UPI002776B94D|nr:hypothetical protein [Pseudomonas protegens]MDP9535899.1 hypothetical protein [Pseudomonas protegens]